MTGIYSTATSVGWLTCVSAHDAADGDHTAGTGAGVYTVLCARGAPCSCSAQLMPDVSFVSVNILGNSDLRSTRAITSAFGHLF